jgi:sterol desaturase/sphingolipid hydroxylase (fatty acid hydroxylase superfamily)
MGETVTTYEPAIRLSCFVGVFAMMVLWEALAPCRTRSVSRWLRWSNNLGLVALNTVLVRMATPAAVVGLAAVAEVQGWGLLNQLSLPGWLSVLAAALLLDLAIYLQHVLFHAVPVLWRLHRMHHADLDIDVTTGVRFHPLEMILSLAIKLMVVAALGPSVVAVVVFEVLLNATSMFNHANVRIAPRLERALRLLVVTPDMHRVHHSVVARETNSNFGFNLPWWDWLLGTYRAQPGDGHLAMSIGIEQFRAPRDLWLDRMLVQPWRSAAGDYPLGGSRGTPDDL